MPALHAQTQSDSLQLSASVMANASTGDFAPYLISALNQGRSVQANAALLDVAAFKPVNASRRFSWGAGAEIMGGVASKNDYLRWNTETNAWSSHPEGIAPLWVQQLYGELKYRKVRLTLGMKNQFSALLNPRLSSGDFIWSGNCRPIPEIRAELDFANIPFTNGWVQINCVMSYGPMLDGDFVENHYNYYNYHIAKNTIYTYKRVHFRTNPAKRVWIQIGAQAGALFGGKSYYYTNGQLTATEKFSSSFNSYLNMIFPVFVKRESFVEGNTLGSWDFRLNTRISNAVVSAYFEWPFEDGSGIGRRNGWDGIWGMELSLPSRGPVTGFVAEYIDFRNQSGPIHYAPGDFFNPTLTPGSTGRDNYYNNVFYNSYAYYGMSIGTPFMLAPVYNLDGFPAFTSNRCHGCHIGIEGYLSHQMPYRFLFSYQRALGTYDLPFLVPRTCTSVMFETSYPVAAGFLAKAQIAYDGGSLRGNNFGALISLSYSYSLAK